MAQSSFLEQYDVVMEVGRLYMRGQTPKEIAAYLSMPVKQVNKTINEWQDLMQRYTRDSGPIAEQIHNIVAEIDQHWRMLVKEAWATVETTDDLGQYTNKIAALNLIRGIQKDRATVFSAIAQQEDAELMQQLEEQARTHDILKNLLEEIAAKYPEAADLIYRELSYLSSQAQVLDIIATEEPLGIGSGSE